MEKNNFNKAYMYIIGIFAIGVAISNIISFFGGVGFAFIGASVLLFLAISNILKSEDKKRFGDIFVLIILEFMLFIVLFFAYDFNLNGLTNKFPLVMRNICAIYSILAIAYVLFRYISEIKGVKYKFVEYMLGNYTPQPKEKKVKPSKEQAKKNKELENGTLAPKPSSIKAETIVEENAGEEIVVEQKEVDTTEEENSVEADEEKPSETEQGAQSNTQTTENNATNNTNRTNYWY